MAKTDILLDIRPDNWAKYVRIVTQILFLINDDILSRYSDTHSQFNAIPSIRFENTNIRPDIRPDNWAKYLWIITKIIFSLNDNILNTHTKVGAITFISMEKRIAGKISGRTSGSKFNSHMDFKIT